MKKHIRRVVTGLNAEGKSTVLFDDAPPNTIEPLPGLAMSDIWENAAAGKNFPLRGDAVDRPIRLEPSAGGAIFKVVTFPPADSFDESRWADVYAQIGASDESNNGGSAHQTKTIDYVIVIAGEISCVLEEKEVFLKTGDVVVQQGCNHAWVNRSKEPATIVGIMIDMANS